VETRDRLPVPDLPGFRTLKGDFHLHTVFSDGNVWPTVRVLEAWRDGFDVIALTDHLEYRPYVADVTTGVGRAYEIARPLADELGIILVPGVEITKPASAAAPDGATAHFNALFVTDPAAIHTPDMLESLTRARAQGAFIFWNHPGFRVAKAEWFPAIAAAHERRLFDGMELVNGPDFYPEAFSWIEERGLAILGTSDAHEPVPPRERAGVRPLTLLFAKTADTAGVREALAAGRTAAWMGERIWGADEHLRGLWSAAVRVGAARAKPGAFALLRARNASALPFRYVVRKAPDWFRLEPGAIAPERESLLRAQILPDAPAGTHSLEIDLELTNLHAAPGRHVVARAQVAIEVYR
jgi:predicted metal-dependent phosphoesterase TrpH